MSYPHRPYYPSGEDDDAPSSNRPAPSRGQTLHSTWAYNLSAMPGANSFPQIYNPGGDLLGEQNNSGHYHRQSNPDPVTGRQQPYGGQYPHSASSMSSSALSYSYNPRGTASTPHPPPHQRHPDGIQQGPLDAQGGRWRDDDPLPPGLKPDYASYAQGEMPESRRTQGASSMLRPNMPNSGYLNMKNARQDDGSITYHAFGNANDGIGDVRSSKEELSSQLEPLGSAMMRFDGNATMDMSNTAPLGNHWGPITGKLSQWTNATLQTPRVNPRYEPSGVPTYNQHNSDQPLGSYTPTNPVSQPPQPWLSTSTEGSLNKDRTYLDPTSAFTHGEPRWRNVGTAPDNAQVLTHHSSYVNKFQADQLPETHLPLRTMPSRSGQPPSVLAGATNQTNDASTKAGHTLHPEHATSDVIDPHPPTSRRTNVREPAKSNVAPDPRPTKRKRSQSSSPPRKSNQRKGRKLGPSSEYEKSKKAFVREKKLACDHCKAHKTKVSYGLRKFLCGR